MPPKRRVDDDSEDEQPLSKRKAAVERRKKEAPGVKKEAHAVKKEAPGVKKEAPGVKKEAPGVKKEAPGVKKEAPGAKKEAHAVKKESPGAKSEEPVAKKKKPAGKKGASADDSAPDAASQSPTSSPDASSSKARARNKTHPEGPTDLPGGWRVEPPGLMILRDPASRPSSKVAAFDLDGTLVTTKSGRPFASGPSDWQWFNKEVPVVLRRLHEDGYRLVIFSNQGAVRQALLGPGAESVRGRISAVIQALGKTGRGGHIPVDAIVSTVSDRFRKPEPGMWEHFRDVVASGGDGDGADDSAAPTPQSDQSFYVGDMAGREGDPPINGAFAKDPIPSTTDRDFADASELEFKTPEELFGEKDAPAPEAEAAGPNGKIVAVFRRLAKQSEGFKAAAYRKASAVIEAWPDVITSGKDLAKEKGIGKGSVQVIDEVLATGTCAKLEEARVEQPASTKAKEAAAFL